MENTWRCARCGHQNLPDAAECGQCKHSHAASERDFESEVHGSYRASNSAVPWIIGAVTFALIFIIGLLCRPNADAQITTSPLFVTHFPSSEPPAELPPVANSNVLITSAPDRPGKAQSAQGEWRPVVVFQGGGAQRTQAFHIRSNYWRISWVTKSASASESEWYGPGTDFKALVYRQSKEKIGVVLSYQKQYSGIEPMKGEGAYYAEVSSPHNWIFRVEEWR